jgi:hypothetical protein
VSYRLVVRPEVDADLIEAEAWYEHQKVGWVASFFGPRETRWTVFPPTLYLPGSFSSQAGALGLPAPVSLPYHLPGNSRQGGYICRRSCCAPRAPVETTLMRDELS